MLHRTDITFSRRFRSILFLTLVFGVARSTAAQPCDFDDDGFCGVSDIDMLTIEVVERRGQPPSSPEFDVSGDGVMDLQDRDEWLSLAATENGFAEAYLLGDGDLDGRVNVNDLMMLGLYWQQRYEGNGRWGWNAADFTMDGITNAADLNEIGKNWQKEIAQEAVPEPMSYLLVLISAAIFFRALRAR